MSRRTVRERDPQDVPEAERASEPAAPAEQQQILALQRSAGNAAVARSILARNPPAAPSLPSLSSSSSSSSSLSLPGIGLNGPMLAKPVPTGIAMQVTGFLETRKLAIGLRVQEGSISMPEVVAMVRAGVPAALEISPSQIEGLVSDVMGRETPPYTRGKHTSAGAVAEIEASIANSFPKPPTSVTLRGGVSTLELSISGIELKTKIAGAKVEAKATKEEGSVSVEKGGVKVGAEGSFKGESFGVSTKVGSVSFGAKLQKENGTWSKWSMNLSVPIVGGGAQAATPAAELKEAVEKAHAAVGRVVAHIQAGGSPTDDVVKKALEEMKPAIEGVSKAAEAPKGPAVSLGVNAGGSGSGWSAGVALIVTF